MIQLDLDAEEAHVLSQALTHVFQTALGGTRKEPIVRRILAKLRLKPSPTTPSSQPGTPSIQEVRKSGMYFGGTLSGMCKE